VIIRVTNPKQKIMRGGKVFICSVCNNKWDTWDKGVACAVKDYKRKDEAVTRTTKRRSNRKAESAAPEQSAKDLMKSLRLPPLPKPKYIPPKRFTSTTVYTTPTVPPASTIMAQLAAQGFQTLPALTTGTSTSNVIDAVEQFQRTQWNPMMTQPWMAQDGRWNCSRCGQRYAQFADALQCAEFDLETQVKAGKVKHDCQFCGTSAVDCAPQSNGCCPECHEEDSHGLDINEWWAIIHSIPNYETRDSDYLFGTVEIETDAELSAFDR
jgi:hypothetical protein